MPRPVPSSLASKPSPRRVWAVSANTISGVWLFTVLPMLLQVRNGRPVLPSALPLAIRCAALAWSTSLPPSVLRRVPAANPFRASRLGAECPRKRSGSRRTGGRPAQFPKSARANTRRRRCATPNHCASSTAHSTIASGPTAQPSVPQPFGGTGVSSTPDSASTTAAKSAPLLELKAPGTFSQRANRHPHHRRAHSMICIAVKKSPERAPASPLRLPATDRSWHGEPNTTRSICPRAAICASVTFVTSPRFGTPG